MCVLFVAVKVHQLLTHVLSNFPGVCCGLFNSGRPSCLGVLAVDGHVRMVKGLGSYKHVMW